MTIQENVSLLPYNTFGFDAKARFFAELHTVEALQQLLKEAAFATLPKLIVGGGSNLLFTRDYEGLVIKISITGIRRVKEDAQHVWIQAGAGVNWHEFVLYCIGQGLGGVENLSLIPGTVGAAPMQNIGAYGVEIKDIFDSLEALHIQSGRLETFQHEACQFGYRESVFKHALKDQYIITSVCFRLHKNPVLNTSYGAIEDTLAQRNITQPGIREISDAVIYIRQSKLPDPKVIGNAGSFFKNPVISATHYQQLKQRYPAIPSYAVSEDLVKIPAGWLIEQAGWKGRKNGQVGVHDKQALVLVHFGGGKGEEVQWLARQIQHDVREKFGIDISPEVNII